MSDQEIPAEHRLPGEQAEEGALQEAGRRPLDFLGFDVNIPPAELRETVEAWQGLVKRLSREAEKSARAAALVNLTRLRCGVAYCVLEDWPEAIAVLEQVRDTPEADPTVVWAATWMLSAAYSGQGDYERTIASWSQALAEFEAGGGAQKKGNLPSNVTELYLYRAQLYAEQEQYAEAIADCDRAERYHPGWAEVFSVRGQCRASLGDMQQALADCDRSIELEPRSARCYRRRGVVHQKRWEFQQALADYDRALELDPTDGFARRGRSEALLGYALFGFADGPVGEAPTAREEQGEGPEPMAGEGSGATSRTAVESAN